VTVPAANVLGEIGQGHKVAFNILNLGRVKLGARNMAGVRQALDNSVKYAKERRQFGKPIAEFGLIKAKLAGMAILGFVGDAMAYRTLGDVERALQAGDRDDSSWFLKTIERFAIECSINKVWTSEALAWAVDEAIQVLGGNGYSREFPAERAYRDARITRIYEGTNEINRLLIPTRLLKQSPELFTETSGQQALAAPFEEQADGPLGMERGFASRAKRLAIALLAQAVSTVGDRVKDEQEILAGVADIAMEAYAVESALARAARLSSRQDRLAGVAIDIARVFTNDAAARIGQKSREVASALVSHGAGREWAGHVRRLAAYEGLDAIACRRRIADAVITAGRALF
jgi:alkylation response protein AidB-like acyl-CoA dehydrogenase